MNSDSFDFLPLCLDGKHFQVPPPAQAGADTEDRDKTPNDAALRIFFCKIDPKEASSVSSVKEPFELFAVAMLDVACLRRHHTVHLLRRFLDAQRMSLAKAFATLMQGAEEEDRERGLLSEMQLWEAAKRMRLNMSTPELSLLFQQLDINQDGYVHLSEFAAVVRTSHSFSLPVYSRPHPRHVSAPHLTPNPPPSSGTTLDDSYIVPAGCVQVDAELIDNKVAPWGGGYGPCAALQNALSRSNDVMLQLPLPLGLGLDHSTAHQQHAEVGTGGRTSIHQSKMPSPLPASLRPPPPVQDRPAWAWKGGKRAKWRLMLTDRTQSISNTDTAGSVPSVCVCVCVWRMLLIMSMLACGPARPLNYPSYSISVIYFLASLVAKRRRLDPNAIMVAGRRCSSRGCWCRRSSLWSSSD
jgi:hypothetical protein